MNTAFLRTGKTWPFFLALVLLFFSAGPVSGTTRATPQAESEVKAVFLFNFTRYLEWPEDNGLADYPIVVLGNGEIIAPLQEIAAKKSVGSVSIQVRQCSGLEDVGLPRILFISDSAADQLPAVLEKFRGTDVLIVGETEGLAERGAAINFIIRDEAVKFEINVKALKDAGIQASSQLLRLAVLVDGEKAAPER